VAQIANTRAFTEGDGLTDFFNIDTQNKIIQLVNGAKLILYADNYLTAGLTFTSSGSAPVVSATAPALANAGTIATAALGVSRVTPAAAVNGIILQPGTVNGASLHIINEGAAPSSIQFAAAGTSNVADGTNCILDGLQSKQFLWDTATALWYAYTDTVLGALNSIQSTTAPALATAGTIATAGLGVSRVAPAAAVTAIILQAGTVQGQEIWVINESAAANSITLNTTPATANVADSATEAAIPGLKARHYVWDSVTALWYPAL